MVGRSSSRRRRRFRRGLRTGKRGVVSVVGTLLALLVFFALFGVFLTQFLPVWMSENEQSLSTQSQGSFAQLKASIDLQVTNGGPAVVATPFQMSSQSIPLLSQPTLATLSFIPTTPNVYAGVSMKPGPGGTTTWFAQSVGLGLLSMQLSNRYYTPQTYTFENDAIVQSQSTAQQVVEFPPAFAVNQTGAGVSVTAAIVQLVGPSAQATSTGPQEIFAHWVFTNTFVSTSAGQLLNAYVNESTRYACAWEGFFNNTLVQSGIPSADYTVTPVAPTSCPSTASASPALVSVKLNGLYSFTLVFAEIRLAIGVGVS